MLIVCLGIQPKNSNDDVSRFGKLLNLNLDCRITQIVPTADISNITFAEQERFVDLLPSSALSTARSLPLRLWDAVANYLDIAGTPKRYFFEMLSYFATDDLQRDRLRFFASQQGAEEMYDYSIRSRRSYMDVLADFSSARPSLECIHICSIVFTLPSSEIP
jgi:sulfite reductase alpha subunit-like flavoprotein